MGRDEGRGLRRNILRKIIKGILVALIIISLSKDLHAAQDTPNLFGDADLSKNLSELIEMSKENPEVIEIKEMLEKAKAKVVEVKILPDPMIEFGYYKKEMGMREKSLMFEQAFSWRGKLALSGDIAKKEVEIIEQELLAKILELKRETKMDFYDLWLTKKELETVERLRTYLELVIKIAQVMYSTGMAPQSDVFMAQKELSMLEERKIMLSAKEQELISKIERCCLGLSFDVKIEIEVPNQIEITILPYEFSELQKISFEFSPMLKMHQIEIEKMILEVKMAQLEFKPDFVASLEFMEPQKNFDTLTAKLGVMYPLYKNKKQKYRKIAQEKELSAHQMLYENERQMLSYNLNKAYLMLRSAEKLMKLYKEVIVPQTSLTTDSVIVNYKVGKVNFMTVLENVNTLFDAELAYFKQQAEYQKAIAEIEEMTGGKISEKEGN